MVAISVLSLLILEGEVFEPAKELTSSDEQPAIWENYVTAVTFIMALSYCRPYCRRFARRRFLGA
jgi:hypothetical protein